MSKKLTNYFSGGHKTQYVDYKGWYFNFDDNQDLDLLYFSYISGNDANQIGTAKNGYKADGDGNYDILFTWDKGSDPLKAGDTSVYKITSSESGFGVSWFNFLSNPAGGEGVYYSAAHVQSIGANEDSGWIGTPVPIPSALLLFSCGLIGLAGIRRKFKS